MHELALTEGLIAAVAEQLEGRRARRVRLAVGQLTAVVPDAMRFCFDVCASGTPLEDAVLEIREVPGRALCRSCGAESAMAWFGPCPCGSVDLQVLAGEELQLEEVEVA